MKEALIIFAKNPVYGRVKTRLAATAGKDKALQVYQKLLSYTASMTMGLNISKFVFYDDAIEVNDIWSDNITGQDALAAQETIAAYGSAAAHDTLASHGTLADKDYLTSHETIADQDYLSAPEMIAADKTMASQLVIKKLQRGNDLGEKMEEAFKAVFEAGNNKAVIIGTDCPELDAGTIVNAFKQLDLHDVVIGPAKDGGYYLLGLKQSKRSLFQRIAWSTDKVFEQTVEACSQAKLSTFVLQELTDIDTEQDLIEFSRFNPWLND